MAEQKLSAAEYFFIEWLIIVKNMTASDFSKLSFKERHDLAVEFLGRYHAVND